MTKYYIKENDFESKFSDTKTVFLVNKDFGIMAGTEREIASKLYSKVDTFIRFYQSSGNIRNNEFITNAVNQIKEVLEQEAIQLLDFEIDINFNGEESEYLTGDIYDDVYDYAESIGDDIDENNYRDYYEFLTLEDKKKFENA